MLIQNYPVIKYCGEYWKIHPLKRHWRKQNLSSLINKDLVRRTYLRLAETPEYKTYISKQGRDNKEEKEILEFVLDKLLLADENFTSYIEENFSNWDDDGEMVIQLLVNLLQKPGSADFKEMISGEKKDFAINLLKTVHEKSEHLQTLIIPKLKNWDPERIALLDMILMKMGVAEFLYFETIPPKVTINEYIDLAKEYSTPQSGQFVNGILDNIHKELVAEGKDAKSRLQKGIDDGVSPIVNNRSFYTQSFLLHLQSSK